jgi:hypothetical protein
MKKVSEDRFGWPLEEKEISESAILTEQVHTYVTEVEIDLSSADLTPKQRKVQLKWQLDEDHRSWGLKSLGPVVLSQKITLAVENNEEEESELVLEIENPEIELQCTLDLGMSISLIPISLDYDPKTKKSVVVFQLS